VTRTRRSVREQIPTQRNPQRDEADPFAEGQTKDEDDLDSLKPDEALGDVNDVTGFEFE
jgi:hypothetical protein